MSTREELLYALEKAKKENKILSGEELARKLGISRVAVWKAVSALKEEGVMIEAKRGSGYALPDGCPLLSSGRIRAHLSPKMQDIDLFTYDTIDSTNRQAKLYAEDKGFCRALFVADCQTSGRGRMGRSFYSPSNTGIYFSYLFSSSAPLEKLTAITPYAAVATARVLEEYTDAKIGVKWVNDLYSNGKKICGILTEAISFLEHRGENMIVVGIGINLHTVDFPPELQERVGSLGILPDRNRLVAEIVSALGSFEENPFDRSFMEEYTARSVVLGKEVELDHWSEKIYGKVVGFDEDGGLLLDTGEKSPRLFTGGEISLKLL